MGHRPVLDIPTRLPFFATDAGSTVEPSQTDKELGHAVGTRPPARWMNDWQYGVYKWVRVVSGTIISETMDSVTSGSTDHSCVVGYPADLNSVVVVESDKSVILVSDSGNESTSATVLTYDPQPKCITTDSAGRVIVAVGATGATELLRIQYSSDVSGAWSTTSSSTFDTPGAISSEGSDGTGVMVGGANGGMYYASVASGTLAAVTTPSYVETGADRQVVGISRTATDSWTIATIKGEVFTTVNNGSAWTAATDITGTEDINHMSYNSVSGRLVAVGDVNIYYSDNNGTTWTTATINASVSLYDGVCVQHVGGNLWMSGWDDTVNGEGKIYGSCDDGESWYAVHQGGTTTEGVYDIGCASNVVILAGDSSAIYRTKPIMGGA